jgi:hypothetical protein
MSSDPVSPTPSFLLLFRNGGPEAHAHLTPAQRKTLTAQWNAWVERLTGQGALEQGRPLGLDGRVVTGSQGERVIDGPYAEAKEVVAGYVMVRAANLDAAAMLAKGCPGLAIGLTVEVRPLLDFSPVLEDVRARTAPAGR